MRHRFSYFAPTKTCRTSSPDSSDYYAEPSFVGPLASPALLPTSNAPGPRSTQPPPNSAKPHGPEHYGAQSPCSTGSPPACGLDPARAGQGDLEHIQGTKHRHDCVDAANFVRWARRNKLISHEYAATKWHGPSRFTERNPLGPRPPAPARRQHQSRRP